jgi:hypothetical protein
MNATRTTENEMNTANEIAQGTVVRYAGRRRRFVVVARDIFGGLNLVALSGAFNGCAPSGAQAADLVVDEDQTVEFTGAKAGYLRGRYNTARITLTWAELYRG